MKLVSEFGDREPYTFFGHVAILNNEERNDLDEYLTGLPEYKEWDDAGTLLRLKGRVLEASARSGAPPRAIDEAFGDFLLLYGRNRELLDTLRRKAKAWCRAMADEPA